MIGLFPAMHCRIMRFLTCNAAQCLLPLLPVEPQAALTPPCVVQAMALLPHSSVSPTSSPTGATMMRAQLLKVVFEADGPLGLYMKVCDEWLYNC